MYGNVYRAVQDPTIVGQLLLDHASQVARCFNIFHQHYSRWVLNNFKILIAGLMGGTPLLLNIILILLEDLV